MTTEIKVPALGESVTEATVAQWFKQEGDAVAMDEALCELETDKVTLEVNATAAGVVSEIVAKEGDDVEVGAVLCLIDEEGKAAAKAPAPKEEKQAEKAEAPAPAPAPAPARAEKEEAPAPAPSPAPAAAEAPLSPAVRKLVEEHDLDPAKIEGTGKDGRLVKGDVLDYIDKHPQETAAPAAARGPREERVKMTRLRKRIAERLKEAQNTAAMLTTFNEVDMTAVMEMRSRLKETFEQRHETKLGFMSFFVKAAIVALKDLPAVNAEIDGEELVYKNHYDIGVAVSTPQGLVVPVVRDADAKSFAAIEAEINDLGKRARDGKLSLDELQGGTFTISNGGIFGSLLSTPILNPPQSGILGMHKIQERPMVVDGEIRARPMMYLALSYDHRIIDGREAVTFLVRMKECLEDPERMLLDL